MCTRPLRRAPRPALTLALSLALAACSSPDKPPAAPCSGARAAACDPATSLACLDACRAYDDVATLASQAMGGRAPGTPGNEAAAALVEARFAALGLQPAAGLAGWRQEFPVDVWEPLGSATLELLGWPRPFEGVIGSGSGDVAAEVVFAGYGMTIPPYDPASWPGCPVSPAGYDDYAAVDVTGKVVLLVASAPSPAIRYGCPMAQGPGGALRANGSTWGKVRNAADHGAAAVLLVSRNASPPAPVMLANSSSFYQAPSMPVLWMDRTAADQVFPHLRGLVVSIDATLTPRTRATGIVGRVAVAAAAERRFIPNVLGVIPGTDPDPAIASQVVVIGAHLDHVGTTPWSGVVFPGADDNASGTAVMLELARAFAGSAQRPRRTLLFAGWNAEELGLLGSCHYTDSDPRYPLAGTVAAFSVDMVGQGDGAGLELFGTGLDPDPDVGRVMIGAAAKAGLSDTVLRQGPLEASDHVCFSYQGIPAVLALSTMLEGHLDYHTPTDVPAAIEPASLAASLRLLYVTARTYAQAGEAALP